MIETIQCDICGQDYEVDTTLFSALGTEYVVVRLADFEEESVIHIKHNTCPERYLIILTRGELNV